MKNTKRGLFIVIDGIDCTGKTTLIYETARKLKERKIKYTIYKEPLLESGVDYICNRIEKGKYLEDLLNRGYIILCDRYWGSTFVYNREVPLEHFIRHFNKGFKPDYEFILEDDLTKINTRLTARKEPELTKEQYEEQTQLYSMYAGLSNSDKLRTQTLTKKWVENRLERILGGWWWK